MVIQGFGNVGTWAARTAVERGATVIAVSDVGGGVHNAAGLDIEVLCETVHGGGFVTQAGVGDVLTNDELLALDCDVLIPAALGEVITDQNAAAIRASVIVEAANYPVTPDGDAILNERGVSVIPDILANAGGVTGSYFEWTMNIQQFRWKLDTFNAELADRMRTAYAHTQDFADVHGCTLRRAAYSIGVQRVADASRMRGYV